jgi:hypothetical protein
MTRISYCGRGLQSCGRGFSHGLSIALNLGVGQGCAQSHGRGVSVGSNRQGDGVEYGTGGCHGTGDCERCDSLLRCLSNRHDSSSASGSGQVNRLNVCSTLQGITSEALSVDNGSHILSLRGTHKGCSDN